MDKISTLTALAALSQETRMDVFRLLVQTGSRGLLSGDIGKILKVRQNTTSANLAVLLHAGLVKNRREGRQIRYFADLTGMADLLGYLMTHCCDANPAICEPVFERVAATRTATNPDMDASENRI